MTAPLLALLLFAGSPATTPDPALLSLPVLDLPDQHGAYAVPTWDQSIEVSKAQYQASHRAIAAWAEKKYGAGNRDRAMFLFGLTWELVASLLPLGSGWAHEEGHRAILDQYGMQSFNGVYDFDPSQGAIYVRRVRDEDLVRLKADHPADSARLAAAGMETQTVMNLRLERDLFFLRGRTATDWATLLANGVNNIGYMWACSDRSADEFTRMANEHDGSVIVRRDVLGLDCLAWAYDLQRRDEPYADRGEHPSGRGIDRYVKYSDLTYDEQKLLRTVRWMSLAHLADPFLYWQDGWERGDTRVTATHGFFMTSFGWSVDQNVFVSLPHDRNLLFTVRHGVNGARWAPGLDAQVWRLPAGSGAITLGGALWLQPHEQRWQTARLDPGGRMHAAYAMPVWRDLELEVAAAYKTAGWVAAVPSLDAETTVRAGLSWRLR